MRISQLYSFLLFITLAIAADDVTGTTTTTTTPLGTTSDSSTSLTSTSLTSTNTPATTKEVNTRTIGMVVDTTTPTLPTTRVTPTTRAQTVKTITTQDAPTFLIPTKTLSSIIPYTDTETVDLNTFLTKNDPNTYVWITLTEGTLVYATSITYTQQFTSMYSSIGTWSSGVIGLGSIDGTVGTIREYKTITLTDSK
ncbi:hypothetical protein CANINC_000612 [Pichia inconspicua]|uniref:Hyphally-regulated cell wall protein N-terminal domain-containing protein n=1 Tax=Pichia inconspicua TaxID=52247 RepID=A0A4T0X5E6_9ASCO|nr:hypothetical protein CANINC_000612 [[Candida] inconspicua]